MSSKKKFFIGILVAGIVLNIRVWVYGSQNIQDSKGICGPKAAGLNYSGLYCDKSCKTDNDCKFTCGCGAINKNEICRDEGVIYDCVDCEAICEEGKCIEGKELLGEEVVITTDKTEYEQGEMVEITVKNNLDKTICFESCNTYFFQKKNWFWFWKEYLRKRCEVNFIAECIDSFEIKEFEIGLFEVDFEKGIYRIAIPIYTGCQNEKFPCKESETIYSNEFTIKQKQKETVEKE